MTTPADAVAPPTSLLAARAGAGQASPTGSVLRTELLHRHLSARVAAARETLEILEARDPSADDRLVARFGERVAEAQRVLAAEKAEADERSTARLRVAEARAAALVADAEGEARLLTSVTTWLRQVPPGAAAVAELVVDDADASPEVALDLRHDDGTIDLAATDAAEAPAS